jgi:hypothetical protein
MKRLLLVPFLLLALPVAAHLNSPHTFLEGSAGEWPLVVVVHMPPAVPGEAEMRIRLQDWKTDEDVRILCRQIPPEGVQHAPDWIAADRSKGDSSFYTAPMAIMTFGNWKLQVKVEGSRKGGIISVPIVAARPAPREMSRGLAITLISLTLLLFVSGWQMAHGLRRDALLGEKEDPLPRDRFRAKVAAWVGVLIFGLWLGFIGLSWFLADRSFKALGLPQRTVEQIIVRGELSEGSPTELASRLLDRKKQMVPVVPAGIDPSSVHWIATDLNRHSVFMHARPKSAEDGTVRLTWVAPAAGEYRSYLDVLRADGTPETIVGDFTIAAGGAGLPPRFTEAGDLMTFAEPAGKLTIGAARAELGDGYVAERSTDEGAAFRAGEFIMLEISVLDPEGRRMVPGNDYDDNASLTLIRHDGEVYVRLSPSRTDQRETLRFPYGFPEPGIYRAWLEVSVGGTVRVAAYDLLVR